MNKGLFFTDIHFGRKQNSEKHNTYCSTYIDWLCEHAITENVDYIAFLGDWFETRNSIDISTLKFSFDSAQKLNNLCIPIYFCVGNHDLYLKNSRDIFSTYHFVGLQNFHIINEPTVIQEILFCPFLFPDEYYKLKHEYNSIKIWAGHFEFKDFVITGNSIKMEHGPDPKEFEKPLIFSGHFHKRQNQKNIHYIGNTFPMDFSDANDNARGCMIFDHESNKITYKNWEHCPTYVKVKLSEVIAGNIVLQNNAIVECIQDVNLEYSELLKIKEHVKTSNNLSELVFVNNFDENGVISGTNNNLVSVEDDGSITTISDTILLLLQNISTDTIDNDTLIAIFREVKGELENA
jgi:DNA repair exonuclease SbcCD nuclease subunit